MTEVSLQEDVFVARVRPSTPRSAVSEGEAPGYSWSKATRAMHLHARQSNKDALSTVERGTPRASRAG